jgi:hypothetical protein
VVVVSFIVGSLLIEVDEVMLMELGTPTTTRVRRTRIRRSWQNPINANSAE